MKSEHRSYRRRRRSPDDLAQLLSAYQGSGLTLRQYAQQMGMGYSTFTKWIRRARQISRPGPTRSRVEFLPVQTVPLLGSPSYQLRWPGGFSLQLGRGFDPEEVRHLLALLPPCSP